jgi:hypothetical protein
MRRLANGVLLEGPVDGITRQRGILAKRLIRLLAEFTSETRPVQPLDAGVIANLEFSDEIALGYHDAGALMSADERHLDWEGPVAFHGVEVGVADARVADFDEDLVGAGLGDRDLLED